MDASKLTSEQVYELVPFNEPTITSRTLPPYEKALSTRTYGIVGLCVSVALGIISILASIPVINTTSAHTGDQTFLDGLRLIPVPIEAGRFLPLLFNFVVAGCTETLSYIHTTSLRWALFHEGRLHFNSNLRLFTSTRLCAANRWPSNFLSAVFLVFCYASSSQVLSGYVESGETQSSSVVVNGVALLMVGVGLLGESVISVWCLIAGRRQILSWSSNPLNAALACVHNGALVRRTGRSMMPVHFSSQPPQSMYGMKKQRSVRTAYPSARIVMRVLWGAFFVSIALACLIFGLTKTLNRFPNYHFFAHNDGSTFFGIGGPSWAGQAQLFSGLLLSTVMQSILVLSLHCAELLVNANRDEDSWRAATSSSGANLSPGALSSAVSSWKWLILFVVKPVAQWLFGANGVQFIVEGSIMVQFNCVPLFVLAGVALMTVAFGEYLLRRRPRGPQPAAFGHLQTLVDLVDDWGRGKDGQLFWGSKGNIHTELGHAGTSSRKEDVGAIDFERLYD